MARSFNDSTDRIDYTATWNPQGAAFSFAAWVYRTQGVDDGYFWYQGATDASVGIAVWHPPAARSLGAGCVELYRPGATAKRRLSVAGVLPASQWAHLLVTDDGVFTTGTSIHIYVDGSEVTYDSSANGVTEDSYDATYQCIGGRYYDDLRNWGGYIAELAVWNRVLSADEISALAKRYSPIFFPNNLNGYWPLVRDTLERINNDYGTLDGTAVVNHPQIIYPLATYYTSINVGATTTTLNPLTGGLAFGEQNPTQDETAVSWQTWSDGAAGSPTISGDSNWGKLELALTEEGRSQVYDFGNDNPRTYVLTENRYGSGQEDATLQIRGSSTLFAQDDETPSWTTYSAPTYQSWRYVQVREIKQS